MKQIAPLRPEDDRAASPEILYASPSTRVLRQPGGLVWKQALGRGAAARMRRERDMLGRLAGLAGVARLAADAAPAGDGLLLHDGGKPLTALVASGPLPLEQLLPLATRLARILAGLHGAGVIHRDLSCNNIVCDADLSPTLIDFDLAVHESDRRAGLADDGVNCTAAYMAPEQTGRTGGGTDHRSDLYSLGVVLYELALGRLPFDSADALEMMRAHLAQLPVAPSALRPELPAALSDLILRLLEKAPDRRYQGAEGLAHDLQLVEQAFRSGGPGLLTLGEHDFGARLTPPSEPVGREVEIAALTALAGFGKGLESCILVSGPPGSGKTTVVKQLRTLVAARQGWFLSGTFHRHQRDLSTPAAVMRALGRLLLAEPEERLAPLREHMKSLIGGNLGVGPTLLPEFQLLLGEHARLPLADPREAEARVNQASLDLLRSVTASGRPVVMVLDDLQWAPSISLAFVDTVVTAPEPIPGLLVVGIYRSGEEGELQALFTRWRAAGAMPAQLEVANLSAAAVTKLVAQMLRQPLEASQELGEALFERTGGSPHEVVELVNALRQEGLLAHREGRWEWSSAAVRAYVGEASGPSLLARRIARLPPATCALLQALTCMGGAVRPAALETGCAMPWELLEPQLEPAVQDGVVLCEPGAAGLVRFRHPRVHAAVADAMPAPARAAMHLQLARRLAGVPEHQSLAAQVYLPVAAELSDPGERLRVAGLFQDAANLNDVLSFSTSHLYLSAAVELLHGEEAVHAERLHALESARHQVLYGMGRLEAGDAVYASLAARCPDPAILARAACVQMNSLGKRGLHREAMETGLHLLAQLGVARPADLRAEIQAGLARLVAWYGSDAMQADRAGPNITDPRLLATAALLTHTSSVSYFCDAPTAAWLVLESHRMWITHGPCSDLMNSVCSALTLAMRAHGAHAQVYAAAKQVLRLGELRGFEPGASLARFSFCMSIGHWIEPVENMIEGLRRVREDLVRTGQSRFAGWSYGVVADLLLDCAPTLDVAATEAEAGLAFTTRSGDADGTDLCILRRQLSHSLLGRTSQRGGFGDASFDEDAYADKVHRSSVAAVVYHTLRAIAAAIFGEAADLARHADAALGLEYSATGHGYYLSAVVRTLVGVSQAERARKLPPQEAQERLEQARSAERWLEHRAADAPMNYLHLLRWLQAELAWTTGTVWETGAAFDAALEAARGSQRPWHAALITERAALFHLRAGLEDSGRALLAQARDAYENWGATGKVKDMEGAHAFLRVRAGPAAGLSVGREQRATTAPVSSDAMDLLAVVRASQSLSSETHLPQLRERVTEILAALTGASRVVLALWQEDLGKWTLPGCGDGGEAAVALEDPQAAALVPLTAFRYAERTRKVLLVEDALRDDRFAEDPCLAGLEQCSLLLVPIMSQGNLRAMLLLENRLRAAAFSGDRLDAVKLIAGQLAVSLENALLYRELEQRVQERTQELQAAQAELVQAGRRAGMAEIASSVLHNVGNVLNSVNVSADILASRVRNSRVAGLTRALEMMQSRQADLAEFLTRDEKGRLLPGYLSTIAGALTQEQKELLQELGHLTRSIDHIKDVVATQQAHAGASSIVEPTDLGRLVDEAVRINSSLIERRQVSVLRDFAVLPEVLLDQTRVMQILVNLVRNAVQAMEASAQRELRLQVGEEDGALVVRVADTGSGIPAENLTRIFSHGFTTREGGHGFGLHSSALAAREMGGSLSADSAGCGHGATFTLRLPRAAEPPKQAAAPARRRRSVAWQELS